MNSGDIRRALFAYEAQQLLQATLDGTDQSRWIAQGVKMTVRYLINLLPLDKGR